MNPHFKPIVLGAFAQVLALSAYWWVIGKRGALALALLGIVGGLVGGLMTPRAAEPLIAGTLGAVGGAFAFGLVQVLVGAAVGADVGSGASLVIFTYSVYAVFAAVFLVPLYVVVGLAGAAAGSFLRGRLIGPEPEITREEHRPFEREDLE